MKRSFSVLFCFMLSFGLLFMSGFKKIDDTIVLTGIQPSEKADVVVIGSEIEGMYLARAAKEEGLSVVILDPRDQPGGQLIQAEMLYLDEPFADGGKSLLQGRVKKLFDDFKAGDIRKVGEFKQYFHSLIDGIPIQSGVALSKIETLEDRATHKKKIHSIHYRTKDGLDKTITAKYWVENTDFAALSSRLGLKRIPGIETVFGGVKDYMAASLMMKFRGVDWDKFNNEYWNMTKHEVAKTYGNGTVVTDTFAWGFNNVAQKYKPSNENVFLRGLNIINQRDGEALINALFVFHVDPSDSASIQKAMALGKHETELILPLLQKELPGWEHAQINGFPNYLYIRDFDRYETEYILQATDLMWGKMFWDNVSIGGYPLDLQGTRANKRGEVQGDPDQYGMPLRSFIPKGYSNVILAGKNIGASAVAFGSARIQPSTSVAAEVIGIMLAQNKTKQSLVNLTEQEMSDLQEYIKTKYDITLTGVKANNKIEKLSGIQMQRLNQGKMMVPQR